VSRGMRVVPVSSTLIFQIDIHSTIVATSVFLSILTNTVNKYTLRFVPPAAIQAGLPGAEISGLLQVIGTSTLQQLYSPAVVAAVDDAVQLAYAEGFKYVARVVSRIILANIICRLVALSSIAFGGVGIIACACCKDVEKKMNNKIEVYMENTRYSDRNKFH
jgi:hypothetical protein